MLGAESFLEPGVMLQIIEPVHEKIGRHPAEWPVSDKVTLHLGNVLITGNKVKVLGILSTGGKIGSELCRQDQFPKVFIGTIRRCISPQVSEIRCQRMIGYHRIAEGADCRKVC